MKYFDIIFIKPNILLEYLTATPQPLFRRSPRFDKQTFLHAVVPMLSTDRIFTL